MKIHLRSNRSYFKIFIAFLIGTGLPVLIYLVNQQTGVSALSATDFKAGRIIDDEVFYSKDTMSVRQIQMFLDRQIPNCDTWGTGISEYGGGTRAQYAASRGWHSPPYACINNYHENPNTGETSFEKGGGAFTGGISAAQIIYDAAQKYNINPQVLLVLLKKESAGPLTSDTWPLKSQYKYAMGYACPDSGPGYSANCDETKAGLYKQVDLAAWQLNHYKENSNDYRYKIGWNDIQYSPDPSCGTKRVYIENLATLSLYIYTPYTPNSASLTNYPGQATCGAYGNRNFFMFFSEWFGSPSTTSATDCNSKVAGILCVWSVKKSDGSQFLTTSKTELSDTMYGYGWVNEGIVFYASSTQKPGTIPVYRLRLETRHHYTADSSEYTALKNTVGWVDEGIAFYALPPSTSTNASHRVFSLVNESNNRHYQTISSAKRDALINDGYTLGSNTFNTLSGFISAPLPESGRNNIYKSSSSVALNNFYTSNLSEIETTVKMGYIYKGVLATANTTNTGTAVHRLQLGGKHLYTTSTSERDAAVSKYGYINEGIVFYVDSSSALIYRLANTKSGSYLYASSVSEVMSLVNTNGWIYEGVLANNNETTSPVYRFINLRNSRHFYTIDINEAARIANKGWGYETIAFYANRSSGQPVYRLLSYDKHFYTTNISERNNAVSKYGYVYEGVVFYVSQTTTDRPAFRLQGGNDEYFYTVSNAEKDTAVTKYNYQYEGIGFHLPSS